MKKKLVRITTVPLSLEKLLEGQLSYMQQYFDVTAIASDKERLKAYGENEGVVTHYIPLTRRITPLQDIIAAYKLYQFLRLERPDVVHTHTPKAGIVGMLASYAARVPQRLHTVAGMPLLEATGIKRAVLNFIEKLTYRFATGIYPNSLGLQKIILSEGFTKVSKLKVLGNGSSNGIDTTYFSPENYNAEKISQHKSTLGIPASDIVFVFVGRIVGDKGINEMVDSFVRLNEQYSNSSLLLVGPFEEDLDPVSDITSTQIENHKKIFSVGFQNDVRPFFASSDILVFPSYREGFPNVVMQAGAMGLPAIVSNINGCNEIVTNEINGLIVPKKDNNALYLAMLRCIENPDLVASLRLAARPSICSRFERKVMWRLLHDEYNKLLDIV